MPTRSRHLVALGCFCATIAAGAAFAGQQQSILYPPELRARPVVVVIGGPWQRRYWDPRYDDCCPLAATRRRLAPPNGPGR